MFSTVLRKDFSQRQDMGENFWEGGVTSSGVSQ